MNDNKPKIILLDIESSPIKGFTWSTYDANVLQILEPSKILSVSWKELGSKDIIVKAICDYKGYKKGVVDDKELVKEVWTVLDEADILIGHHSDSFDIKKLNARFIFHGLTAPSSYKSIDTKKVASKYFAFDSNSLNNLCAYFGIGQKIHNGGFPLWVDCMSGDPKAWELMKKYNSQDVLLLEKLYFVLRPYITNHPNLNAVIDKPNDNPACPSCLSPNVTKRGFSVTRTGRKQRFQCGDCGSWSSGPFERTKKILSTDDD